MNNNFQTAMICSAVFGSNLSSDTASAVLSVLWFAFAAFCILQIARGVK